MSRRRLSALLWSALACWAAGVLWLSTLSPAELPESAFWLADKANHLIAYALGGWLAARALRASRPHHAPTSGTILAILMVAAFGILDEALQTFTPGRTGGSVGDWIADLLGAATGALLSLVAIRR